MNFYTVELPCGTVTAMVNDLAVADVHSGDCFHLPIRQCKIEDGKIFLHAVFVDGFGDGRYASLVMPAENYLGGGLCVLFAILVRTGW